MLNYDKVIRKIQNFLASVFVYSFFQTAGVKCTSKFCRSLWQVTTRDKGSQAAQRNSVVCVTYVIFPLSKTFGGTDMCQKGISLYNVCSTTAASESA